MPPPDRLRVGYVLKRYPHFSQTFILNEILAHEAADAPVGIFSLRAPRGGPFHASLARVRAPVVYLPGAGLKASRFWRGLVEACDELPGLPAALPPLGDEEPVDRVEHAIALAREVRARRVDHLHAHFGTSATSVARLAARIAGISYSCTLHARDIFHESVVRESLGRKIRDAAAVVTVSRFNLAHLRETFPESGAKLRHVDNGLDLEEHPFVSPFERAPLILGVGRLVEKKGFADLVDACAELAGEGRSFRCEIVGSGPLQEELEARIARHRLGDRVALLGPLPHDGIRERLRNASLLAAPCVVAADGDRDGLPTVLLEAMAAGTPCVSTDVTGIPEVLESGRTGMAVPQHAPKKLAEACRRLLEDPHLRLRLARGARWQIEQRFDIRANAARLREIFREAASAEGALSAA